MIVCCGSECRERTYGSKAPSETRCALDLFIVAYFHHMTLIVEPSVN